MINARNAAGNYAVELRNISKIYPGSSKKANDDVSLGLRRGEILCIAGENGAGKTTLMKILDGIEPPSSGRIFIDGQQVNINSPLDAKKFGIGMAHQHFMIFPEYTVAENIVMGSEPRKWGIFFDTKKANALAEKIIREHHFSLIPERPASSLSVGEMQQAEICRLLYRDAKIIILDEPSSALTERETESFFKTLKALAGAGKSLILITHKLREIKQISDRVAVLRRGKLVDIKNTAEIDEREISRMMLGETQNDAGMNFFPPLKKNPQKEERREAVIAFENVTVLRRGQEKPLLDNVSFALEAGEILGFAGVGGNGLGALEAVLGGFLHPASGRILRRGRDISRLNIRRLRNEGLAYVPADRLQVGSALEAAIDENIIINRRREFSRAGFLDRKAMRDYAGECTRRYNIAGAGSEGKWAASSLSGGNLQKLILAREIDQFKDYIVFSEPTWGLDIAAGSFVWKEIIALRDNGAAVILISTNLDEVLHLADRIIVMYRGKAAGHFLNHENESPACLLKEKIGACMQGLETGAVPGVNV
ncbi:MAG TPA: ABC transporter ATP-binding protein [Treponema sp.]|nr:ABC transporter ATP-binding protein [Treponema sp.]